MARVSKRKAAGRKIQAVNKKVYKSRGFIQGFPMPRIENQEGML